MAIRYELVEGAAFALQASQILEEAWSPPCLCYTPDYLRWQMTFPGNASLPAAVAFDGSEAVGFAGASRRRVRGDSARWDVAIVSFVAVRPRWRNQGVAAGLYGCLLAALKESGTSIVTYAAAGSGAERLLLRVYAEAGFAIQQLGAYPIYTFLARGEASPDWKAVVCADATSLPLARIAEDCAADSSILWTDAGEAQIDHYLKDPRPRRLIAITDRAGQSVGAAWAVRTDFRTLRGVETVTALESTWLPRRFGAALPIALQSAATAWSGAGKAVVTAPSLYGFDPDRLRQSGIRQTGAPFHGYLCIPDGQPIPGVQGTSLEVI